VSSIHLLLLPNNTHILFVLFPGTNVFQQDGTSSGQTVKQHHFSKDEFHYLNVTQVGTFTVNDIFDCIFECLSNPSCFSVNLAASKEADGKLWCDLLSSDKYRNSRDYKENMTSHHLFVMVGSGSGIYVSLLH
jgi:hypothetical protein